MNWEQKLAALNAISECRLLMRKPGDWYVSQSVERKEGHMLASAYGNGATPQEAVENHWTEVAEASSYTNPIVLSAYGPDRREVFWNGFMWADKPRATVQESASHE